MRVAGLAPFTEAELQDALRLRLGGGDHRVEVVSGARVVTISVDGKTRSVRLGTERGAEAARVVALVAAAIVLDDAQDAWRFEDVPAAEPAPVAASSSSAASPEREAATRWTLAALVTPAAAERTQPGGGAWVAYDRRGGGGGARPMLAIGVTSSSIELGERAPAIRTVEVPLRAGAWLGDSFAAGVSAVAVPYLTRGGAGDANVLFGAGVMARAQLSIVHGASLVAQVGVDGMLSSVEYRWEGEPVLASGRVRPWLAVGVTWVGGP
ncbi:MAG TPA: hypothetical protein VM261_02685 [Kofleriaceae bacterium]|nr:hypothetical protein [Kofleriaceae bacterium]